MIRPFKVAVISSENFFRKFLQFPQFLAKSSCQRYPYVSTIIDSLSTLVYGPLDYGSLWSLWSIESPSNGLKKDEHKKYHLKF